MFNMFAQRVSPADKLLRLLGFKLVVNGELFSHSAFSSSAMASYFFIVPPVRRQWCGSDQRANVSWNQPGQHCTSSGGGVIGCWLVM